MMVIDSIKTATGTIQQINKKAIRDDSEMCCYIILTHYGTYYTGITNNLLRRWQEHKKLLSSYLSRYYAKEVVYVEFFSSRKEARKCEVTIKRTGAAIYIQKKKYKK